MTISLLSRRLEKSRTHFGREAPAVQRKLSVAASFASGETWTSNERLARATWPR
jgi:hypothetical protein